MSCQIPNFNRTIRPNFCFRSCSAEFPFRYVHSSRSDCHNCIYSQFIVRFSLNPSLFTVLDLAYFSFHFDPIYLLIQGHDASQ
jgi:hypothetical protein